MKIVGLDILLYAVNPGAPHHDRIVEWWEEALNGDETVGLAWAVSSDFCGSPRIRASFRTRCLLEQAVDPDRRLAGARMSCRSSRNS